MAKQSLVPKVTTDHYDWATECSPSLPRAFSPWGGKCSPLQRVSRLLKMSVRSPTIWHLATNTNSTSLFACKYTDIFPKWNSSSCSTKLYTKKKKKNKTKLNKPSLSTTNSTVMEEGLYRSNKHSEIPLAASLCEDLLLLLGPLIGWFLAATFFSITLLGHIWRDQ